MSSFVKNDDDDWGRPLRKEILLRCYRAFGNTIRKFVDGAQENVGKLVLTRIVKCYKK